MISALGAKIALLSDLLVIKNERVPERTPHRGGFHARPANTHSRLRSTHLAAPRSSLTEAVCVEIKVSQGSLNFTFCPDFYRRLSRS